MENLILEYLVSSRNEDEEDYCDIVTEDDIDRCFMETTSDDEDYAQEDPLFSVMSLFFDPVHQPLVHNFINIAHNYSEDEFKDNFRIARTIAEYLIDKLVEWDSIPVVKEGFERITAEFCLLTFLSFLSDTSDLTFLSRLFKIGQNSLFRVFIRIVAWFECLMEETISWPNDHNRQLIQQGFQDKRGIVKCIGVLGATYIPIIPPVSKKEIYLNKSKRYSVVFQAVVDHEGKFTNIHCGDPGSYAFASVLKKSSLFDAAQSNLTEIFPNGTYLLTDSEYPLLKWLVPPFIDNGRLKPLQYEFNLNHADTKAILDESFGLLITRFPRLSFVNVRDLDFVCSVVVACCVLHNVCIEFNDQIKEELIKPDSKDIDEENDESFHRTDDKRMEIFREIYSQET